MKQLFTFLLLILLFNSCYSQSNYIEYIRGIDPIIVLATHGGNQYTNNITNRDCGKHICVTDLHTDDLARRILLEYLDIGINPHVLIMNLDREEIDLNRPIEEACNDMDCEVLYNTFHNKIKEIIQTFDNDKVLILDIHGHSHSHALIELGYNIKRLDYNNTIYNTTPSSLNAVSLNNLDSVIRGMNSLGTYFNAYEYKSAPSNLYPVPPSPYFDGGYITEQYSKYRNVAVIQFELPYYIRETNNSRTKFAKVFTKITKHYYDTVVNK